LGNVLKLSSKYMYIFSVIPKAYLQSLKGRSKLVDKLLRKHGEVPEKLYLPLKWFNPYQQSQHPEMIDIFIKFLEPLIKKDQEPAMSLFGTPRQEKSQLLSEDPMRFSPTPLIGIIA